MPDVEISYECAYELLLQHRNTIGYLAKKIFSQFQEKITHRIFLWGWGFADPMHLFIKHSIFHNYTPNLGPRFWDIFSISGNALMNHFFSIVISCEKAKYGSVRFADPMHLFIKYSIFHNFWPKFRPRFWDIFSISGNALMNHFFSIVISCEKAKKRLCEVLRIRCTFSSNIQFFIIFGPNLGPDFEIFSQFQEMPLWITSSASCYLAKKQKTVLWGYADPMHLFIKSSIFHYYYWPNFGPRFWDIFSISGNALMNYFFSIVISCENGEKRLCEVLRIRCTFSSKIQFFIIIGLNWWPRFWDIFSISGNALMNHWSSAS